MLPAIEIEIFSLDEKLARRGLCRAALAFAGAARLKNRSDFVGAQRAGKEVDFIQDAVELIATQSVRSDQKAVGADIIRVTAGSDRLAIFIICDLTTTARHGKMMELA